jgi:agmatine deiminase
MPQPSQSRPRSGAPAPAGLLILLVLAILGSAAPRWALAARTGPALTPPEQNSLPIGMTPDEEARQGEIGHYLRDTAPPPGPGIRQAAEWEPVTGALVRYPFGLSYPLLKEIAEKIELWVLVASGSDQTACANALTAAGVDMTHVHFVLAATNSIWTRDYGPQFMFDANGDQGIVDHHYNRPRPLDDQVNYTVGTYWSLPVYGSPVIHTGGNYMCDGHNHAFSTNLVYSENPGLSHAQVDAYMQSYLGINTYHVVPDISTSGIHHIDCWAKLLNEETILVKRVASTHPDYAQTEANVATLRTYTNAYGRPYKIVRIDCPSIGGTDVASYTNSVVLNDKILVPIFNIGGDAAALQTYRDAMPGYEVIGFTGSWLSDDAIHCRVMGIHDKYMLRVDVAPLPDTLMTTADVRLGVVIDDRSEAGLKSDSLLVYWRTAGQIGFHTAPLIAASTPDSFYASIPAQSPSTRVDYYVFAADLSNRRSTRPPSAPGGTFSYVVGLGSASTEPATRSVALSLSPIGPNPFVRSASVDFRLAQPGAVNLSVLDIQGRRVAVLAHREMAGGAHRLVWNGRDDLGREVPAGVYFFRLTTRGETRVQRGVLIR